MMGNPTVLIGGFPLPDLLDVFEGVTNGLKKLGRALADSPKVKFTPKSCRSRRINRSVIMHFSGVSIAEVQPRGSVALLSWPMLMTSWTMKWRQYGPGQHCEHRRS